MRRGSTIWIALLVGAGCGDEDAESADPLPATPIAELLQLPVGFPLPQIPERNPLTAEKIELGRHLFYETRLSGNQTQSCGSCHFQELAFADGLIAPTGSTGQVHTRNSQGLSNAAYNANLTWANPLLDTIEQQILGPLFGETPIELGAVGNEDEILGRLASDPLYQDLFTSAFPEHDDAIEFGAIVDALASFVRTMISGNSPFDQLAYQDNDDALSDAAKRGMTLFFSEVTECHHCHGGFNFTFSTVHENTAFEAEDFHNTGLYNVDGEGAYPASDRGVFDVTGNPGDMGKFRAPSLRNVGLTAPYMHDGSVATLEDVIRNYEAGGRVIEDGPNAGDGRDSPLKSGFVQGFALTDAERDDLIEFLNSLTDDRFVNDPRFSNPFELR